MKGALDVHRELLARDVPHEVVRLSGRLLTADDLPRVLSLQVGCVSVRCYVVERASSSFAAVLVVSGTEPSPSHLREALEAWSVRPASPDEVNVATDYAAGLVSPVCLPPEVELVADVALERSEVSYCALGEGGVALGIRTADLLAATGARLVALTDPAAPDLVGAELATPGAPGPSAQGSSGRGTGPTEPAPPVVLAPRVIELDDPRRIRRAR